MSFTFARQLVVLRRRPERSSLYLVLGMFAVEVWDGSFQILHLDLLPYMLISENGGGNNGTRDHGCGR